MSLADDLMLAVQAARQELRDAQAALDSAQARVSSANQSVKSAEFALLELSQKVPA